MAELERWREDIEGRFKEEIDSSTERFSAVHKRIDNFKAECKEEFEIAAGNRSL